MLIRLVEGERPLIEGGVGTYAIQAPMELFETVISFLSNSLSYVRVGAFAIAHVVSELSGLPAGRDAQPWSRRRVLDRRVRLATSAS